MRIKILNKEVSQYIIKEITMHIKSRSIKLRTTTKGKITNIPTWIHFIHSLQ